MEKLNELISKACLASELGKKGITVDMQMLSQIRDEFWVLQQRAEAAEAKYDNRSPTEWAYQQACAAIEKHRLRAEAAETKLAQRNELDEEAMHCATILEFIGSFDSDDIDGDEVDLRFEIDGEDTGCDVSITEYALRSAKAIRSILSGASISRQAPAADLAELVPPEMTWQDSNNMAEVAGFNECRDIILRNIEEAKK